MRAMPRHVGRPDLGRAAFCGRSRCRKVLCSSKLAVVVPLVGGDHLLGGTYGLSDLAFLVSDVRYLVAIPCRQGRSEEPCTPLRVAELGQDVYVHVGEVGGEAGVLER
jgi:hypothetical protein